MIPLIFTCKTFAIFRQSLAQVESFKRSEVRPQKRFPLRIHKIIRTYRNGAIAQRTHIVAKRHRLVGHADVRTESHRLIRGPSGRRVGDFRTVRTACC